MKTPNIDRETAQEVLDWCWVNLGPSRFNKNKPKLYFYRKPNKEIYGQYKYWKNTIQLYGVIYNEKGGDNLIQFIDTIIHEYWHYKQNLKEMFEIYFYKYKYNEDNHPYERTAIKKAKQMRQKCYNDLFKY